MNAEILKFVEASKQAGASDTLILLMLESSPFTRKEVALALRQHYESATGVTLTAKRSNVESSRDAFLYLLSFSTLATWAWALGRLSFHFIDQWFPDPVFTGNNYVQNTMVQSSMAAILIAFPIYLLVMRMIARSVLSEPERLQSPVRKWLTYIALLFAAGFLIGDAITFLEYLLRGELSMRFISKVVVVLVIAGGIFSYYLNSVRGRVDE